MNQLNFTAQKIANGLLLKDADGTLHHAPTHTAITEKVASFIDLQMRDIKEGDEYHVTITRKNKGKQPIKLS